jgi:hypothetical protein
MSDNELLNCQFTWTAFVLPLPVNLWRMKLKNIIPKRYRKQLIRRFGDAKLVKLPNGQHELLGGSDADRTAAFEWVSLFAHKIVFTHFHREPKTHCQSRKILFPSRLQPAM